MGTGIHRLLKVFLGMVIISSLSLYGCGKKKKKGSEEETPAPQDASPEETDGTNLPLPMVIKSVAITGIDGTTGAGQLRARFGCLFPVLEGKCGNISWESIKVAITSQQRVGDPESTLPSADCLSAFDSLDKLDGAVVEDGNELEVSGLITPQAIYNPNYSYYILAKAENSICRSFLVNVQEFR